MKINLWFSVEMKQWRWTLSDPKDVSVQESGQREDLRSAMEDVANTVEYVLQCKLPH